MRPLFFFVSLSLLFLAFPVYAHVNGISYEKEKDGYLLDAGYGAPAPTEGESLLMDFRLRKDGKDVEFTDTWVRISDENGAVVFASGIHNATFGGPRMSYVFPKVGKYTVSFRFENDADTLVEDSFPITVIPASSDTPSFFGVGLPFLYMLAGFVAGVFVILLPRLLKKRVSKGDA